MSVMSVMVAILLNLSAADNLAFTSRSVAVVHGLIFNHGDNIHAINYFAKHNMLVIKMR